MKDTMIAISIFGIIMTLLYSWYSYELKQTAKRASVCLNTGGTWTQISKSDFTCVYLDK